MIDRPDRAKELNAARVVHIGPHELIQGDCLEVMPALGEVDAVFADPPYGVGLGEHDRSNHQAVAKNQQPYGTFSDTPEYVASVCVNAVRWCVENVSSVAATTGNRNMWLYPQPADFGVWWSPAGTSRGKWGFQCVATPILYWGKDPYLHAGKGSRPSSPVGVSASREVSDINHPCPKPLSFMLWMVERISFCAQTILDPFMGSGTTGVACQQLGRSFIGIEKDPDYFKIACKRVAEAHSQPSLFEEPAPKKIQNGNLFDGDAA